VLVSEDVEKTSSGTYNLSIESYMHPRAIAFRRVYRANEATEVLKESLLAVLTVHGAAGD
jgi:hypothetical protein